MPNYKQQSNIIGESWNRSHKVVIDNPLNQPPIIHFLEELVFDLGNGEVIKKPLGAVYEVMTDPAVSFSILDVDTGEVTGTATYNDVYTLLHSLYMHLATRRDVELATQ